ncbi:MAG: YggS family pyridoxal phosphate-dependent enzyme [Ardenticatenaceae bacterium]
MISSAHQPTPLLQTSEPCGTIERMLAGDLGERLRELQERIAAAAARAGRNLDEVTLVSVTKMQPPDVLRVAYEAGLRDFGENRVGEFLEKREALDLPGCRWHFIGHVQGRKARQLIGHTDLLHSVDRLSLARELSRRAEAEGVPLRGLLQVNSSGEESKGGWPIHDGAGRDVMLREMEEILSLPALRVRGMMTMAPLEDNPERTRPVFAAVRAMQHLLQEHFPEQAFDILSMGMTNDFEVAVEEGATHVRIGTALFRPRELTNNT